MSIEDLVHRRFGIKLDVGASMSENVTLENQLNHRSYRHFREKTIPTDLLTSLFSAAFSAPSKSDLQQCSVILVRDKAKQRRIAKFSSSTRWVADAPLFMVWCGDNRRIRRLAEWRKHPFANEHLDAFMNSAVDAAIVMQNFIVAAEAVGLGCCPVSEIRDQIAALSSELGLPEGVFPVAGLVVGWPSEEPALSLRLPLEVTVHQDHYDDANLLENVAAYDKRREASVPTPEDEQRLVEEYGISDEYGWSENRTRQYSKPARADFGAYIRKQGFSLE